ncbi:MAG: crossover junction endodeoxyribonuclease RuvC [bacterium]
MSNQSEKVILGLDPGYADLGYGLVVRQGGRERCLAYGSLRTPKGMPAAQRLGSIYDGLTKLINDYRPAAVAVEKLFFSKNVTTAISVAEARGVILLCLDRLDVPYVEFNPAEVKMAVCGHGAAGKPEMQKMVRMLLGLRELPKPDDAADALALALALASTGIRQKTVQATDGR